MTIGLFSALAVSAAATRACIDPGSLDDTGNRSDSIDTSASRLSLVNLFSHELLEGREGAPRMVFAGGDIHDVEFYRVLFDSRPAWVYLSRNPPSYFLWDIIPWGLGVALALGVLPGLLLVSLSSVRPYLLGSS